MKSITSTPESGFRSENWKHIWIYRHNLHVCGFPKTQSISTLSHWLLDMIFHRRSVAHSDQQGMCVVSFDAGVPWITRVSGNTHFNSCHLCCIWGVEGCDEALVWKSDSNRINYCNAVAHTLSKQSNWSELVSWSSWFFYFLCFLRMATYCIPSLKLT